MQEKKKEKKNKTMELFTEQLFQCLLKTFVFISGFIDYAKAFDCVDHKKTVDNS